MFFVTEASGGSCSTAKLGKLGCELVVSEEDAVHNTVNSKVNGHYGPPVLPIV